MRYFKLLFSSYFHMVVKLSKFKINFKLLDIKQANQQIKNPTSSKGLYKAIQKARRMVRSCTKRRKARKKSSKMMTEDLCLARSFLLAAFISLTAGIVTGRFWYRNLLISLIYCYTSYKCNSINIHEFFSAALSFLHESSLKALP